MIVISGKDLTNNGGVFYATNKLISKIGSDNIINSNNIHIKNNNSIFLYKKTNVKTEENTVVVTYMCKGNRVVFVLPK